MNLLSLFRRRADSATHRTAADDDAVSRARTRARRRLIGAIVLVAIGVVALPVMFDGEPRPLPPDIPIEIPRKDGIAPLTLPPRVDAAPAPASAAVPAPVRAAETPTKPDAPAAGPTAAPADPPAAAPGKTVASGDPKPPAPSAPDAAKPSTRAATDSRPAAVPEGPRFVVQVGAFADPSSARDAVERVQKLGLKPFTQVVQTEGGARTRVRLGPFATREEAQRVQARTEAAGIKSAVMPQ